MMPYSLRHGLRFEKGALRGVDPSQQRRTGLS
jgi:hypothetical protein